MAENTTKIPDKDLLQYGCDMIYLAECALRGQTPERKIVEDMCLPQVYKVAKKHMMAAVTYMALESFLISSHSEGWNVDTGLLSQWMSEKNKALKRVRMMDEERSHIMAFLEDAGIWYMGLKGIVLKDLYPKPGMRQMSDNDILFDSKFREQVRDYMVNSGYTVKEYNISDQDVYLKPPVFLFEMHAELFEKTRYPEFFNHYANVKSRLLKVPGKEQEFRFSDEDFYIYFMTHAYKHYAASGNGIRFLMDVYLYTKEKTQLDWGYIEQEMDRLGILRFAQDCRMLANKLFEAEPGSLPHILQDGEQKELFIYLYAGPYGNRNMSTEKQLHKEKNDTEKLTWKTKLKYFWNRLFPGMDYFRKYAPFFYKYKVLLPFYLVYWWISKTAKHYKRIWKEIKFVWKFREE